MATFLTIDIGNSSAKAVVWRDGKMMGRPIAGKLTAVDIHHLNATVGCKFDCTAICSVSSDFDGITAAAAELSDRLIEVNAMTPIPIDIHAYTSEATLGADRIAAMVGARGLFPGKELLVVDCGTAITYDRLSDKGVFLGGNIAPGIGMRLKALYTFTSRLPMVETAPCKDLWGHSTSEAMRNGAFRGVIAEVQYYREQSPKDTCLVLTGGRSRDVFGNLPFQATIEPDLVLRGLKHIIEYNIDK